MIIQLAFGTLIIVFTVAIEAAFMGSAIRVLTHNGAWLGARPSARANMVALSAVVLWLLAGLSACAWVWALAFLAVGEFDTLEAALYFAIVTFTTLGYGDITLSQSWRLLSGVCAANGLLLFGLSTAFLVEFFRELANAHSAHRRTGG